MAKYDLALDHLPELSLSDSSYNPAKGTTPTLPGSVDAFASPMKANLAAPPPVTTVTPPVTPPRGIPIPGTPPPATPPPTPTPETPAQTYLPPDESQISQLVDQLDKQYGIQLGVGWRDQFQRDPQGFRQYLAQIAADPSRYRGTVAGHQVLYPGMLDQWLARVNALYTNKAPQTDFTAQRNAIFDEAQQRIQQQAASGGRPAEEELLSALGSRGLLDSGMGAKVLADFRSGRAQDVSNALSELRQMLDTSALDVSSREYLGRLFADIDYKNQLALLQKRAELEKASQPSPWWNIAGAGIGALPFLLSPKAPGGAITPEGSVPYTNPTNPGMSTYRPPPMDPYGLKY